MTYSTKYSIRKSNASSVANQKAEETRAKNAQVNIARAKAQRAERLEEFPKGMRVTNGQRRGTVKGYDLEKALLNVRIDHIGREEQWAPDPSIVKKI